MLQQFAILFHKENAETVAEPLIDYTAEELLEEYKYMFESNDTLVLCRDELESGKSVLSYVVTIGMFCRNTPGIDLNHKTYTFVRTVNP